MKRLAWKVVLFAGLLLSQTAMAAPSPADKELAKKHYMQGVETMERGAFHLACPEFEMALQLDPEHIRTAMTLGTCEQNWGKLARALTRFEYARSLAVAQNASEKLVEIDRMIETLRPQIPQLRIIVPEELAETDGLVVTRNGVPVPANEFGRMVNLDPATYEIAASIPGKPTWTQKFTLYVGKAAEVTVGLGRAPTFLKGKANNDSMADNGAKPDRPLGRTLGFVGLGLGGAGIVLGGILGSVAITKNDASDQGHCDPENYCDAIGKQLRYEAQDFGNGSTVAFLAGGALLTAGIVLIATTPTPKSSSGSTGQTKVFVGLNQVGIRGTF